MNDLSIPTNFEKAFPTTIEGLKKAWTIFDSIKNFEDIEREFLLGRGLSPNTYRNYLGAVKDFYKFTGGIHPLQVKPADIERYYDHLVKRVDRNTAYLYIRGLKKFFSGIRDVIPIYSSPFDTMDEKLIRKLSRTKKGNRTKKVLSPAEVRRLLAWLKLDTSILGKENYAIVYMLVTSGLRADELCQLHWKDLEYYEGKWTAYFVGKGGKEAEQELYELAVNACCDYFREAFKRDPDPEDALFWTVPSYPGDTPRSLPYASLWHRIKKIGSSVKEEGVIKRNINFSPHLFRRSYATGLYKSGMGIRAIQEKTRHASIETLVKHYIHDEEPASKYLDLMLA